MPALYGPGSLARRSGSRVGHVETTIRRAGCDLDTTTGRRGRPHGLACAKNQASYRRRAGQRAQDLEDLALLTG